MRRITITLIGPFAVAIDGVPVSGFAYAKVRALLAYLAMEARQPHSRAALATLLWPDQSEQNARGSLSQALTTLRNALGDKTAAEPVLLADAQQVQLNPRHMVEVDASQFLAELAAAETHTHRSWRTCATCAEHLRQAMILYRGSFLADVAIPDSELFEEWVGVQRTHLQQRALSTLERLVDRAQWRGDHQAALAYAQRLVELEPWLESSQRTLMRSLALNGEMAAALAHYRQLHTMLAQELDAEPEQATTALFAQLRRGDTSDLQPTPPPFVVPIAPTPLVGRGNELAALCSQLRETGGRILTVTGTGGIGKTRLALEVAHAVRHDFEDGVFVVELAALSDATLVADAIARVLGIKEQPHRPISDTMRDQLAAKHMLLVLDNFEHVLEAAPLVSELRATCPALSVLVTSRAPLDIRGERQFALEPLADGEAVQLFVERAEAVGAGLASDAASTSVYAAICQQLDRLPLAIELIAMRTRTLTPRELLQQLKQPLQALAHGPRDMAPRHQSLRHAIQWSYDLLNTDEQRAFRALGVFAGGCTIESAQALLGPAFDVLPTLESLHRASLLQRQHVAEQTRFVMLETIREFAQEQLNQQGEMAAANQRHGEYFAQFAMTAYVELLRADAPRWRAWIAAEQGNLRGAFRWAREQRQHDLALQLGTGVWRFHWMMGSLREGLEQLETALVDRELAALAVQVNALRAAGIMAGGVNDYARARRWLEAAVEVCWRLNDKVALQATLTNLGYMLLQQGELEEARVHLEVSLSLARRQPDAKSAKFPLGLLAGLHLRLGNYPEAQLLAEECLQLNRTYQDVEGTANAMYTLGTVRTAQNEYRQARQLANEAMALHHSLSHQPGIGMALSLLGDIARGEGAYAEALTHYQQCLSLWHDREYVTTSTAVLDSLAALMGHIGHPARGITLSSATAALRERTSIKLTTAEQTSCEETISLCRAQLSDSAFIAAWAAGCKLSLRQAIDLALQPLATSASATE